MANLHNKRTLCDVVILFLLKQKIKVDVNSSNEKLDFLSVKITKNTVCFSTVVKS